MKRHQIAAIGIVLLLVFLAYIMHGDDTRLKEADERYRVGESAKTIIERQQGFNQALELYRALEADYHPRFGTGKLYYNMGNAYFQLGAYPWALLYYHKALELMPREESIKRNIALVEEKLSLPHSENISAFSSLFILHTWLSLPERLQLFLCAAILALVLASTYLWTRNVWIMRLTAVVLVFVVMMLLSLGYTRYLAPVEGMMITAADLRRDAGTRYAKVREQPVPGGTVVEILGTTADGAWLKVLTPDGNLGYIPQASLRPL